MQSNAHMHMRTRTTLAQRVERSVHYWNFYSIQTLQHLVTPTIAMLMNPASEKSAVVLELGSKLIKCGLSEERAPRGVLRWEVRVHTALAHYISARSP